MVTRLSQPTNIQKGNKDLTKCWTQVVDRMNFKYPLENYLVGQVKEHYRNSGRKRGGSTANEERKANKVLKEAEARNQQMRLLVKEANNTTENLVVCYNEGLPNFKQSVKKTGGGPPIPEPPMVSGDDYPENHPANPLFLLDKNPAANLCKTKLIPTVSLVGITPAPTVDLLKQSMEEIGEDYLYMKNKQPQASHQQH